MSSIQSQNFAKFLGNEEFDIETIQKTTREIDLNEEDTIIYSIQDDIPFDKNEILSELNLNTETNNKLENFKKLQNERKLSFSLSLLNKLKTHNYFKDNSNLKSLKQEIQDIKNFF